MKRTETTDETQPQNGLYGRLPLDLIPTLQKCSNLEVRVFAFLTMLANFKREPIGMVECESFSWLAKTIGIQRKSLYRSIERLQKCGLVTRPGRDTCVVVTHYLCREDTPPVSPRHTPVSPRHTKSTQPQPSIDSYEPPIRSEEVSEKEVKKKASSTASNSKKSKSKSASKKKPSATAELLKWDSAKSEVTGDAGKARLREKIYQHYDDLGEAWINATWASWHTYCDTHPDYVDKKKDLYLAALNWFSGDAKKERQRHQ